MAADQDSEAAEHLLLSPSWLVAKHVQQPGGQPFVIRHSRIIPPGRPERARAARKAEREQARQAHDRARVRYEGLTKAQLSDQLAGRNLPKTGTVEELTERLIEDDNRRAAWSRQ